MKEIRTIEIPNINSEIKDFPYQLIKWQASRQKLDVFLETFKEYPKDCVIVNAGKLWSIFTKGTEIAEE